MAEMEGFELSISCPMAVFETAALNHSATSPFFKLVVMARIRTCEVTKDARFTVWPRWPLVYMTGKTMVRGEGLEPPRHVAAPSERCVYQFRHMGTAVNGGANEIRTRVIAVTGRHSRPLNYGSV